MHKKLVRFGKEIAKQFAISFFFSSLVIVTVYFTFYNKIDTYLSLANMVTIEEKDIKREEISFDSVKKTLVHYPYYGEKWGTIKIPDINVEAPLYNGDSLDIIKYGVGKYTGSYFPGEGGSIVLAAHNSKQHFGYLYQLKEGAKIIIEANYGTFTYELKSTKIIHYQDTSQFPIQSDKEILMMYTCYPSFQVGFKTQRYVVYAELVGEEHGEI